MYRRSTSDQPRICLVLLIGRLPSTQRDDDDDDSALELDDEEEEDDDDEEDTKNGRTREVNDGSLPSDIEFPFFPPCRRRHWLFRGLGREIDRWTTPSSPKRAAFFDYWRRRTPPLFKERHVH